MTDGLRASDLLPRCTFPSPGTEVTCAVSGGPDSLALLVLAVEAGCAATAVHVDHGLRPGSDSEAAIVAAAARRVGAGFRAERVEVPAGGSLEARARAARRAVLPAGTLYGHTADDQAETVLLGLVRGSGLEGLRGMRPDTHPILGLRRHETEALCESSGLVPFRDPSNSDPRFRRNRVRHELLPLLDDIAERDTAAVIARTAAILADDADLLDALAAGIDPTDAAALRDAPVPLARRAIRRWVRAMDAEHHPPDAAAVDRILAVARGEVTATHVGGGLEVRRSQGQLSLRRLPRR